MVRFFASAAKARAWFERNHDRVEEQWIGFYKVGAAKKGATYAEVLDQALCFGWIDGVRKRIDETRYMIRFSPRTRRSGWSKVNVKRFGELKELGVVRPAGLKAFEERDPKKSAYSYERENARLDAALEARFRENAAAWTFFEAQPPGYRRLATWWIMSAKREETRLRRLEILIRDSASGSRSRRGRSGGSDRRSGERYAWPDQASLRFLGFPAGLAGGRPAALRMSSSVVRSTHSRRSRA